MVNTFLPLGSIDKRYLHVRCSVSRWTTPWKFRSRLKSSQHLRLHVTRVAAIWQHVGRGLSATSGHWGSGQNFPRQKLVYDRFSAPSLNLTLPLPGQKWTFSAFDHDAQVLASHAAADAAAHHALRLIQQHHALGGTSYLERLIAQKQAQQSRIYLVAAQSLHLADTAALYQAMGGGWSRDISVDEQTQPGRKGENQMSDAVPS